MEKREREGIVKTRQTITTYINKYNEENFQIRGLIGPSEQYKTAGRCIESLSVGFSKFLDTSHENQEGNRH